MISLLFFTQDDAPALARSLLPLVHEAVEGNVSEVIVSDGGSGHETADVADAAGCAALFVTAMVRCARQSRRPAAIG